MDRDSRLAAGLGAPDDGHDTQRVAADAAGQEDAPRLRFDAYAPDLANREIDPREPQERAPARGPREGPEHVHEEEDTQNPGPRMGKRRGHPRLALELRALAAVDANVAAPKVQRAAAAVVARHRELRRRGHARIPAAVAHRNGHRYEHQRSDGQRPRQAAPQPPSPCAHGVAPARARAGHSPRSVRMTPSSYPTRGENPSKRRALAPSKQMGRVITSSFS